MRSAECGIGAPCESMIFEKKFGMPGCRPRVLQNAVTGVTEITLKHTKTHKCTVIFGIIHLTEVMNCDKLGA